MTTLEALPLPMFARLWVTMRTIMAAQMACLVSLLLNAETSPLSDIANLTADDPAYAEALATILETPSNDGIHLGPTDAEFAALALRLLAESMRAEIADAPEAA